jgi:hypothetical protein
MHARFSSLTALVLLVCSPLARCDERSDAIARQKTTAMNNMEKVGVEKPNSHESADLILCGVLPTEKLKALGEAVQKQYAVAFKAVKYGPEETPWTGKLAVYVFTEKGHFNSFIRQVEQRRPEPEQTSSMDVRSDNPHAVLYSDKTDIASQEAEASKMVTIALMSRKAGTNAELPRWFTDAFARAVRMRSDPRGGTAEKAAIRRAVLNRVKNVKPSDAWMAEGSKEQELIALGLVDYLSFGPESEKFPSVLAGFRPSDGNANPTMDSALMSAGFTAEALEKGWKKWVQTGK